MNGVSVQLHTRRTTPPLFLRALYLIAPARLVRVQVGLNQFPNDTGLLLMAAHCALSVKENSTNAKVQLQLAIKTGPNLLEQYAIFASEEIAKGQGRKAVDQGVDLVGYVEFQRNYRCGRWHDRRHG